MFALQQIHPQCRAARRRGGRGNGLCRRPRHRVCAAGHGPPSGHRGAAAHGQPGRATRRAAVGAGRQPPDAYTVKRGDTLWDISSIFLTSPWRWPELWGMNKEQIANPHLIYPGQTLRLVKGDGRARLELAGGQADAAGDVVRLSPTVRDSSGERRRSPASPTASSSRSCPGRRSSRRTNWPSNAHRRHAGPAGARGRRRHRLCAGNRRREGRALPDLPSRPPAVRPG